MKKNFALIKKSLSTFAVAIAGVFLMLLAFIGGSFLISRSRGVAKADTSTYWTDYAATKFAGGSGDPNDPYQISNASELAYLAAQANIGNATVSRYYKLTKAIDLSAHYWNPIGQDNYSFNGVLDCNNKPIIGLKVDGAYEQAGLFGLVDSLIIKNAIISNASINITNDTGSAGIIAGTINNSVGSLQVINSQISGSITSLALPSTKDGIGGIIGSIRGCSSANTNIENVYLTATINAPNRPNNTCMGVVAGSSDVSLALGTNIKNIVTNTSLKGKDGTATNLTYYGDFGGTGVSPWFYYNGLQGGIPQIKSQYYIGANISNTGTQIVSQLEDKNFTHTNSIATFIPEATKYTMTIKTEKSNNTTRSGFTASAQTRTGSPYAVNGERVTLSNTNVTGYQFTGWKLDSKAYDRIGSKDNLITPTTFTGVAADVIKLGRKYMFEDKISVMVTAYMDNWSEFKTSSSDMRLISCKEAGGWNFEPSGDYIQFACYDKGVGYKSVEGNKKWSELSAGWHTFLGVFDGSYAKLYVDGEYLAMSTKFTSGKIGYNSGNGIFVGGEAGSNTTTPAGFYFKGKIGCVLIQNDTKPTNIYYTCAGANETLTARWVPNQYTVTYNPNNGSVSPTTKVVTYDAAYGELATPTKTGYTFSTWRAKNLFDKSAATYSTRNYIKGDGNPVFYAAYNTYQVQVPANAQITIKNSGQSTAPGYAFYTADGTYISGASYANKATITVTVPSNANYIRISVNIGGSDEAYRKDIDYFQIELGSSATTYDAYKSVTASTVVSYPNDHVLTANWAANTYQVKYNANGGTGTMNNSTHTYDVASSLTANAFTRTGYIFAGWATTSAGSVAYADKASVKNLTSKQGDVYNLYAKWTAIKYQVKYNANGGSGSMSNSEHTYDVGKNLTKNTYTFTRAGYTFAGWATSSTGAKVYNDEASVTNLSATNGAIVELYAKWTAINYTITLNANGGSGGSLSKTTYNISTAAQTITIIKPTRNGYTLSSWTVTGYSGGTASASETTLTIPANTYGNLTVKAEWTAITYQVRYNANGGSGSMSNSTHTYDVAKNLTANAFTKEGYSFTGWATSSSGDKVYNNQASVTNLSSTNGDIVDLYATWRANTYELTLDGWNVPILTIGNRVAGYSATTKPSTYDGEYVVTWVSTIDGASSDTNDIAISGLDSMMSDNGTYRLRFKFKTTNRMGSWLYVYRTGDSTWTSIIRANQDYTDVYIDGLTKTSAKLIYIRTSYPTSGDKYYFSNFELHPMVTYNTDFTFPKLTKTGYTFSGWYGSEGTRVTDGSGNMYFGVSGYTNNSGRWGRASNTTLYRRWAPNVYKVTFNKQSGSGGTTNIWYKYEQSSPYYYYYDEDCTSGVANYKITIPTRTGYTFKGYFTALDESGTQYVDSSGTCINNMYLTAGDKTLYAYWEGNSYLVYFNPSSKGGLLSGYVSTGWSGNNMTITYDSSKHEYKLVNSSTSDPFATIGNTAQLTAGVTYSIHAEIWSESGSLITGSSIQIFYGISRGYTEANSKRFTGYTTYHTFTPSTTGTYNFRIDNDTGQTVIVKNFWVYRDFTTSKSVSYKSTYGTLPTPIKPGYTFAGWYNSSGNKVNSSTVKQTLGVETLTGKFTLDTVTGSATATYSSSSYHSGWNAYVTVGTFKVTFNYINQRGTSGTATSCTVYVSDSTSVTISAPSDMTQSFTNKTASSDEFKYTVSWNASTKVVTITLSSP